MALNKLRRTNVYLIVTTFFEVDLRICVKDWLTTQVNWLLVLEEVHVISAGDLGNSMDIKVLEMAIGQSSIKFGKSWDLTSIGVVELLQPLPPYGGVHRLIADLERRFLFYNFPLVRDAHQLILPLISGLDGRKHALDRVSELSVSFLFLHCHQILIHFVDFVSCAVKTFEVAAYLGLGWHSIIGWYSHHISWYGAPTRFSALYQHLFGGPVEGLSSKIWLLGKAL